MEVRGEVGSGVLPWIRHDEALSEPSASHRSAQRLRSGLPNSDDVQDTRQQKQDVSQERGLESKPVSEFPQSTKEAQLHIERIREQKLGVHGQHVTSDIEAALNLISGDLYQNSMHFLYELLQNFDDNDYQDTDPAMKITYCNHTIQFDTNEVGFRYRDVEAICSIGHTSKKESNQWKRRIGEKGIGFKSVFRIAQTVFINSGFYSFKFTTNEPLGMIAPKSFPFPGVITPGYTSILLNLRPDVDDNELGAELKQLDGRILMFLQKLKRVELKIVAADNSSSAVVLQRNIFRPDVPNASEMCAVEPDNASPYFVFRYAVSPLPAEARRKGWNESEIVLAFPMGIWDSDSLVAREKSNYVFSFLPIRDYGFKFVLQGDFILVSSREEIDPESEWNRSLRSTIADAFFHSLDRLRHSKLRYTWPYYVPMKPKIENFFQDVWLETSNLLAHHPILESVHGTLSLPSMLYLVPKQLSGLKSQPLIPPDASIFTYISSNYPADTWTALENLGVKVLSATDLLDDLSNFIEKWPDRFRLMSPKWHSRLAQVLDPLVTDYEERVMSLPFIQLRDGTLVSPGSGVLLFPVTSDNMPVPDEIRALVVHNDANSDHSRKILFQKLGAQTPDKTAVCRMILDTHNSKDFDYEAAQMTSLISHVSFLHKAGWDPVSPEVAVWVVAEDGSRHHGHRLYLNSGEPYSMKQLLNRCNADYSLTKYFSFMHLDYSTRFIKHEDRQWLQRTFGISDVPRLFHRSEHSETYTVDPGFKLLLSHLPSIHFLQMLKVNWAYYRRLIVSELPQDTDGKAVPETESIITKEGSYGYSGADLSLLRKEIRMLLSEMTVICWDGPAKLCRTCLPRKDVLRDLNIPDRKTSNSSLPTGQGPCNTSELGLATDPTAQTHSDVSVALFPMLNITDPEDPAWDFLKHFGVIVSVTAKDLVKRLESLKQRPILSRILRIYKQILACTGQDGDFLRRRFNENELVYIPEECAVQLQRSRWISLDACVWDGPTCLKKIPRLKNFYSELEGLFCSKLKLPTANLNTLIAETALINSTDSLPYIRSLLKQLSHMSYGTYYHTRYDAKFYDLIDMSVFPVWTGKRGAHFDELRSSRMSWYIADAPYLLDCFEGKVPLLAFEPSILGEIKDLIANIGWENRKLRKLAVKELSIQGFEKVDYKYTHSLQDKWRCISRLVPSHRSDRINIISQLRSIQVFEAESICVTWKVTNTDGGTFLGSPEKGRTMLTAHDNLLKLYLTQEDMTVGCPSLELIDELAAFCGIETSEHIRLLSHILVQSNTGRIEQDLDRCNVPYLAMDFDLPASRLDLLGASKPDPEPISRVSSSPALDMPFTNSPPSNANSPTSEPYLENTIENMIKTKSSPLPEDIYKFEPRAAAPVPPTKQKPGRPKLVDGWRSQVYGNTALSQENHAKMSKEKHATKLETSKVERSKTDTKEIFLSKKSNKLNGKDKGKETTSSTEDSSTPVTDPRNRDRPKRHKNQNPGLISLSMPVLAASRYRQVEEIRFTAELYVAGGLAKVMGSDFIEQQHWTGYLRSRAGHKPYDPEDPRISTFTLSNMNNRLTKFLTDKGYSDATFFSDDPVYHIQVVHSLGPIGSIFHINSNQVEKARLLSQFSANKTGRKEVFILAYVYNIFGNPEVALYPDPWSLYATGLLSLEAFHDQEGRLNNNAPAVHIESSAQFQGLNTIDTRGGRFKYRDLKPKEIRILDLSPGNDDEPLKGVIRSVPLTHAGEFQAISYVWGVSPNEISPYYLFTQQGAVLLNFSLHSTLRAIRGDSTISVWADGICINQQNPREKALQIGMLGEIFQAAEQVTAWLGHAYRGSDDAMKVLSQIQPPSRHDYSSRNAITDNQTGSERRVGKVPDPGDVTWEHINSLLRRPWFTRVWITQELVLPRKVILLCGQSELDWDRFFEALTICERESNRISRQSPDDIQLLPDAGPAYALGIARKQRKEGKRFRLLKLFEIFEHAEASIEADKLFAFLGLAQDGSGEEFMPDYESTLEEVVRRYSKGFILRGHVMELLYRAGGPKSYEFCSWIPRWTQGQFPKTISTWDVRGGPFKAGTPSAPLITHTGDRIPQSVVVDGYIIDTIHSVHRIKWGSGSSLFFFDAMVDFKSLLSFVKKYPTGESTEDLLLYLPIGNAAHPHLESDVDKERSYRTFATQEHYAWPPNLRELILSVDNDQDPSKYLHMSRHNQKVIAQYWQTAIAFSRRLGNAGFSFTKGRYVGLVPEAAVAGDQICLFHGGNVPFVVRERGPAYTLVGECYIHGIMNGEALQWDGLESRSFALV
ncbi:hypothetical protein RRF57_004840 [Xylaria bambusicola]|uniref:Heterokaryon incompatibility domain-containing protein n=1 Tax=Xylaria bambusicola TaxID=326684 RepID=A0AAN7UBC0_9PEZI